MFLPVIASTLRSSAAGIELEKVEQLGSLAQAIFNKIASAEGDARGIFSTDAAAEYSKTVGREVRVEEIHRWLSHWLQRTSSCDAAMGFMRLLISLCRKSGWRNGR